MIQIILDVLDTHLRNHLQKLISPVLQVENVHLSDLTSVTECCNNAFFISGSFPHHKFKIHISSFISLQNAKTKMTLLQEISIRY